MSDFLLALQSHCTAEMLKQKGTSSGKWPAHPCLFRTHTPHILDVQVKPTSFLGTCRFTPGHYSTTQGTQKVGFNFLAVSPKKQFLNLFLHVSQVQNYSSYQGSLCHLPFLTPLSKIKGNMFYSTYKALHSLSSKISSFYLKFSSRYYVLLSGIPFLGAVNTQPIHRTPNKPCWFVLMPLQAFTFLQHSPRSALMTISIVSKTYLSFLSLLIIFLKQRITK